MKTFYFPRLLACQRLVAGCSLTILFCLVTLLANSQIVFDVSPGQGVAPPTLGPYSMMNFATDTRPNYTTVTNVGSVGISPAGRIFTGGATWTSPFYAGALSGGERIYLIPSNTVVLTMPANTKAFYFYMQANQVNGTFTYTAQTQDGTVASVTLTSNSTTLAQYFGFYVPTLSGLNITSITISLSSSTPLFSNDFAIGHFGINQLLTPSITASPIAPSSCTATDGKIRITGLRSSESYWVSYQKSGNTVRNQFTANTEGDIFIENLGTGVYQNIVVDLKEGLATTTADVELIPNGAPTFSVQSQNPATCKGEGSVSLSGLLPNTSFRLSLTKDKANLPTQTIKTDGSGVLRVADLTAGNYTVTAALVGGCNSNITAFTLQTPPRASITFDSYTNASVCGQRASISFNSANLADGNYLLAYQKQNPTTDIVSSVTIRNNKFTLENLTEDNYYSRFSLTGIGNSCAAQAQNAVQIMTTQQPTITAGRATNPWPNAANGTISFTTTNMPNGDHRLRYNGSESPKTVRIINNTFVLDGLTTGTYSGFTLEYNGCVASDPSARMLIAPNGRLGDKEEVDAIEIAPNPTTDYLGLQLRNMKDTEVNLSVVNSLGQRFITQNLVPQSELEGVTLDVRRLSAGTYFVEVVTPSQKRIMKVLKMQ